jgi:hypothetical protein
MARPARPEPKVFLSAELTARGLDWYESTYFSHATSELLFGEKSTSYVERPEAARRSASVLGSAEIIVLLRDPVARAVSNWQFSTENGLENRPLAQALTDNLEGARPWDPAATSVSPYAYLERGRYAGYLEPWYERFPECVHVRFFEELVGNHAELAGLYEALAVDPSFQPEGVGRPINRSQHPAPDLEPDLEARLREYFSTSDSMLGKLLDRELPWPRH